nr:gdp-L-galactose phosphorylase 1 [Ipomoea batatas]
MSSSMMLRIKRVPTLVSNFQKEEGEEGSVRGAGCGRNCLRSCCLPGSKLPLYAFKKLNNCKDSAGGAEDVKEPPVAFLDSLLLGEWEERMQRGLFRYDVTACETKVIPGEYGFIAQLNEGRHLKKRPTEFRVDKVLQPFDGNKFNFTKSSPSVVAINVSPIEYGHVLLIPKVLECLPQRIDRDSFLLALHMAEEAANPYFRLGYNSLGAFATINHLHFQAYYLAVPFPIEKAPTRKITTADSGVKISEILNYPVRGLLFEGGSTLEHLANVVSNSCICLQENNIPYNVLISDLGKRVFLLPQCYAEKQALGEVSSELLDTQVNPAVWEISGHMVLKRKEDYEGASEANAWRLLAEVSLSEERFQEVTALIFEAIGCNTEATAMATHDLHGEKPDVEPPQPMDEEIDSLKGSHPAMVPV